MRISDIISLLKEYLLFGLVLIIIFFIGYKLIYKKIMKGTKTIKRSKLILYAISICYISVVIGAVFFNRGGIYRVANLHIFSSYKEAYNKMEISSFRNIILNILMFVPLGFLLPMYSDKLKKVYKVVLIGFFITLAIEVIQYLTGLGICEIDDIFNNTLGGLIGYSIFMIYNNLRRKQNRKYIIIYLLPMILTIGVFALIYIKYQIQEFGNLQFENNYKINMKNVDIQSKVDFSNEISMKEVYFSSILKEEETKELAEKIFSKIGTSIDENETDIYENTAIYWSNNREYNIWIDYNGGTYSYTDFSKYNSKEDYMVEEKEEASKEEVENALGKLGIEIPKSAEFKKESKGEQSSYIFTVKMERQEGTLIDGILTCSYYKDKTVKSIKNNLIKYEKIADKELISEQEAYNEILKGNFGYDEYYIGTEIRDFSIEDIQIGYFLDTKGYYVPVYEFDVQINGRKTKIYIRAIRELCVSESKAFDAHIYKIASGLLHSSR